MSIDVNFNFKTIAGESIIGEGDISIPPSEIKIDVTPIIDGVDGGILYQKDGKVHQSSKIQEENGRIKIVNDNFPTNILAVEDSHYGFYFGATIPSDAKTSNTSLFMNAGETFIASSGSINIFPSNTPMFNLSSSGLSVNKSTVSNSLLDIKSKGVLNSDVSFRVRNFLDNADVLSITEQSTNIRNANTSFIVGQMEFMPSVYIDAVGGFLNNDFGFAVTDLTPLGQEPYIVIGSLSTIGTNVGVSESNISFNRFPHVSFNDIDNVGFNNIDNIGFNDIDNIGFNNVHNIGMEIRDYYNIIDPNGESIHTFSTTLFDSRVSLSKSDTGSNGVIETGNNSGVMRLGFYGSWGISRPDTSTISLPHVLGGGVNATVDTAYGGYTVGQIVNALKGLGLLT